MDENKIKIAIDGQESILTLQQLEAEISKLSQSIEGLDESSDEFKELTDKIAKLKEASKGLNVKVSADTSEAQKQIDGLSAGEVEVPVEINDDLALKEIQEFKDEAATPVDFNLDVSESTVSIQSLRTELKATLSEIASAEVGSEAFERATIKAGQLRDQIDDVNEAVNAQKGEPIERLGSQFSQVSDSVSKLDFSKATEQFKTLRATMAQTDFSALGKSAKEFGSTILKDIGGTLKSVGTALLTNPLLLLATVFVGIGVAAFKLRDSIKPVQVVFDAIGKSVEFVTNTLKGFSDALGLSNFKELDAIKKTSAEYEKREKQLDQNWKNEQARLNATGKSKQEILDAEKAYVAQSIENTNRLLAVGQNELNQLQKKIDAGKPLSDEEQKRYDTLAAAQQRSIELSNQELSLLRQQEELTRNSYYATEKANAQISINNAKTDKERLAAQKEMLHLQKEEQIGAITRGRMQNQLTAQELKDIELINSSYNKSVQDTTKTYTDKWSQAAKQRNDEIKKLNEQYLLDERAQLSKQYDDQVVQLNKLGIKEGELIDAINAKKLQALTDYDNQVKQKQQENFDRQIDLQNEMALREAEANQRRIQDDPSLDIETRKNLEIEAANQIAEVKKRIANDELSQAVNALNIQRDQELNQLDLTESEKAEIVKRYDLEIANLEMQRDEQVYAAKKSLLDLESKQTKESIDKELDLVRAAREKLMGDNAKTKTFGVLGLFSDLKALKDNYKQEEDALKKSLDNKLISQEEYNERSKELEEERARSTVEKIDEAAQVTSSAITMINDFFTAQNEQRMADLDLQQQALEADYEARKQWIEENIKDEAARTAALTALDTEFNGKEKELDAQRLKLQKEQIKRDRNAALAQILLSNAAALAGAVKSSATAGNPAVFFTVLAAMIASIVMTIKQAKTALKQADAAAGAVGAGGGGSVPSDSGTQVGSGVSAPAISAAVPSGQPTAINNPLGVGTPVDPQQMVIRPVVSVLDIDAARERVSVSQTSATIG